jgi:hypothetical protein
MNGKKTNDEVRSYPFAYGYACTSCASESQEGVRIKTAAGTQHRYLGTSRVDIKESYMKKCRAASLATGIIALIALLAVVAIMAGKVYRAGDGDNEGDVLRGATGMAAITAFFGYWIVFLPVYALAGRCFLKSAGWNIAGSAIDYNMSGTPLGITFRKSELREHVARHFREKKLKEIRQYPPVVAEMKANNKDAECLQAYPPDFFGEQ